MAWPPGGLLISNLPGHEFTGDIISDGVGGAYVAYIEQAGPEDSLNLYLQRVTGRGEIAWPDPDGFPLCTATGRQFLVRLARGDSADVFATWYDERGPSPDIYAQRVRGYGTIHPGWAMDGRPVCTAPGKQISPVIAPDGHQGAYIAWEDARLGFDNTRVYIQRMNGLGTTEAGWPADGVRVSNANGFEVEPWISPCADGGAYVTWVRREADWATANVVATLVTPSGSIAPGWPDSGLVLCAAPGRQDMPTTVEDGQGGLYAVWRDYRDDPSGETRSDIYAQRVARGGTFPTGWGGDGLAVRSDTTDQWIPRIASDGQGGMLVSWLTAPEAFVQRITPSGAVAPGWAAAGVSVGTITAGGQGPALTGDGMGGAIVAWSDYRGPSVADVYAQRITADGLVAPHWPSTGVQVSNGIADELVGGNDARTSTIVPDGEAGALVAWIDGWEVALQRITGAGVAKPSDCCSKSTNALASVSPNPGRGSFRATARVPSGTSSAVVEVYDVFGRKRRATSYDGLQPGGTAQLDVDLSGLPVGIYYLRYSAGPGSTLLGSRAVVIVR
jgi:hypothetical protein